MHNLPVIKFVEFSKHTILDKLVDQRFVFFLRTITNVNIIWLTHFSLVGNIILNFGGQKTESPSNNRTPDGKL